MNLGSDPWIGSISRRRPIMVMANARSQRQSPTDRSAKLDAEIPIERH